MAECLGQEDPICAVWLKLEKFRVASLLWKVLQIHSQEKNPNLKTPVDNVSSNTALSSHCRCNSTVALLQVSRVSELTTITSKLKTDSLKPCQKLESLGMQ